MEKREGKRVSREIVQAWRLTQLGMTQTFAGKIVAISDNPGPIFDVKGRFFRFSDSMMDICAHDESPEIMTLCSPKEVRKAREIILFKSKKP